MIFSYVITIFSIISTLEGYCDIQCANIFDEVCGMMETKSGRRIVFVYQNICYLRRQACKLQALGEIYQVPNMFCGVEEIDIDNGRRVNDFGIVGAHQACNHTCPLSCADTYDPACAQIWHRNMKSSSYRPMINHCHIDVLSCTTGLNVTIRPLGRCYKNPTRLMFMQQVAALKSLNLLNEEPPRLHKLSQDINPGPIERMRHASVPLSSFN